MIAIVICIRATWMKDRSRIQAKWLQRLIAGGGQIAWVVGCCWGFGMSGVAGRGNDIVRYAAAIHPSRGIGLVSHEINEPI